MLHSLRLVTAACAMAACLGNVQAFEGSGLQVHADRLEWTRWQNRLSSGRSTFDSGSSSGVSLATSASLSLMSDYYLTDSLLGPKRAGGFRATSGLMIGPRGQGWTGPVPARYGISPYAERRGFGQAPATLPGDASYDMPTTVPYLGVGYTGLSLRGGWSFSADLGVMSLAPGSGVKFGRMFSGSQGFDDTFRDMRWSPVLQLGVSYSF